uniref:Suppressor of white apricot N-terminal domain-containing protein n=1 Tax=Anopheles atroparvus TaxID=41427 RepID=A0AAG5D0N6_ANOAO
MWHEARKQEKKIRGMLVDYRKRAERRQDFYERIKADPTQFLQVHGRKCKIHLDASVATAAENPAIMMPWQGQKENLIDRFDVRAHLDYIPPVPRTDPEQAEQQEEDVDERAMNYERYRVLAQNEFLGVVEEKYLHQLYLEEQFGVNAQVEAETKAASAASKKKSSAGAAIGYTYEETETVAGGSGLAAAGGGSAPMVPFVQSITAIEKSSEASSAVVSGQGASSSASARFDECMKDESDSDLDMDVSIDINKIGNTQAHELNTCGRQYGMKSNDFYSFLTKDADEADALRMAREEEQEKIMFSGRKSRRERRAQRERKFAGRPLSPPSYAAKEELVPRTFVETNDSSRSPSPVNSGKITYITSFGGEDELQAHAKISFGFANRDMSTLGGIAGSSKASRMRAGITGSAEGGAVSYADKVKQNLEKLKAQESKESDRKPPMQYQRTAAMGRGRGSNRRSRSSRSSSSSRSRSRSRGRRRSFNSSRSRSRSRARSKSPGGARGGRKRPKGRAVGHRSRSRSVEGGVRGSRGVTTRQAAYSRYRGARPKSHSRSRSRSRSASRNRSRPRWSPRRRSPPPTYTSRRRRSAVRSSSSSSSSSTSSSRSRSGSPAPRRTAVLPTRAKKPNSGSATSDTEASSRSSKKKRGQPIPAPQEKKATQPSGALVPQAVLSTLAPLPPPPPPPPLAGGGETLGPDEVDEKKPIAALALIEPEPEIPIKRYYGRRRGDESSSDELSTSGEDTPDVERKPRGLVVTEPPAGEESGPGTSKIISTVETGIVQIKQEKPDTGGSYGTSSGSPAPPPPPTPPHAGTGASLRFGKTVTGGTSAPESKVAPIAVASVTSGSGGPAPATVLPPSKAVNPRDRLKRKMQILLNKQYKADKKAEIEKVERQIQQQQERDDEMRELALKLRRRQRELRHKYGTPESEHSKSHSSDDRSSDDGGEGGHRFGAGGRETSASPQRAPLLSPPPLTSVPPPKMPLHTARPPPSLLTAGRGGPGYGNSVVIERKPVLRSALNSGGSAAQSSPALMVSYGGGGEMGRLRRRHSPPTGAASGGASSRGFPGQGGMSSSPMTLRRGGGMGGGRAAPASSSTSSNRFDDRNRRRSPPRYNRSRSKSRERYPARDTTGSSGANRGRRMEYGRSRDYDRPHQGGGGGYGGEAQSGGSSGRFRGRRSRSGSHGRRSRSGGRRSGSPMRTRGNGGSGAQSGNASQSRQRERSPKPVKKLVDY